METLYLGLGLGLGLDIKLYIRDLIREETAGFPLGGFELVVDHTYFFIISNQFISNPTINDKIHCQTAENGVVLDTPSNLKLLLEIIWSG